VAEVSVNDQDRPRLGNHVYGTFGHDFGTSDGRRVMVTAFTRRHWKVLVEGLGMVEKIAQLGALLELNLDEDAGRFAGREAIAALFRPWFAARTLEQVAAALNEAGTCWGPYQTVRQAVEEDPRLSTENPMYSQVEHPDTGSYLTAGSILDFSGAERQAPGRARRLGEDTEAVLADVLGVDANQYAKLRDAGVVG
jgi:2-methylfumaryl-CoA isomerase